MAGKRVRIQSAHGILIPGGLANSPRGRAMMWRSKSQTVTYLAAALVLYGLFATSRNLLGDGSGLAIITDIPIDFNHPPSAYDDDAGAGAATDPANCPEYGHYSSVRHEPFTGGTFNLPYQRPARACRKVVIPEVEELIREMNQTVKDRDLFRLFENCFPNTLDTSVTWTGLSSTNKEELTFITTGDIHAMWLRDSANQLQSYVSLLKPEPPAPKRRKRESSAAPDPQQAEGPSSSKLASLFRGAINLQARYIRESPHCNAFRAPAEAAMSPAGGGGTHDVVWPHYSGELVFECKYELDSLAAFLQLSWDYYARTKDAAFFRSPPPAAGGGGAHRESWRGAVAAVLAAAEGMRQPTYAPDGAVASAPYRFERSSTIPTETLGNRGNGSPVRAGTGLVRSSFRPSDDATTYQFLIPANMMMAKYLELCAEIMVLVEKDEAKRPAAAAPAAGAPAESQGDEEKAEDQDDEDAADADAEVLSERMKRMAKEIKKGVDKFGKYKHPEFGEVLAYETDGYFSHNMMDDANLPSLLSTPLTGYLAASDPVYRATRKLILSDANPYYGHGPVLNGTGGPHIGPGMVWPMSLIVAVMTSDDDAEIKALLRQLLGSTDALGLMHESVSAHSQGLWTRSWFSWANGLFGQMMLDLKARKPHILKVDFQGDGGKNKNTKD